MNGPVSVLQECKSLNLVFLTNAMSALSGPSPWLVLRVAVDDWFRFLRTRLKARSLQGAWGNALKGGKREVNLKDWGDWEITHFP